LVAHGVGCRCGGGADDDRGDRGCL
jgi:hypothetical protein